MAKLLNPNGRKAVVEYFVFPLYYYLDTPRIDSHNLEPVFNSCLGVLSGNDGLQGASLRR